MKVGIAAVQADFTVGDIGGNAHTAGRLVGEIMGASPETDLIVFPEMALWGYTDFGRIRAHAREELDRGLLEIANACAAWKVDAVVGAPFITEDRQIENSLYWVSAGGGVERLYSKLHLIDVERAHMKPGEGYAIRRTRFGRVGFLICWDTSFPEPSRLYGKAGVDLLVSLSAWEKPYDRQFELAVCSRAFENGVPVAASNRIGRDGAFEFFGRSMIADSIGNILAECGEAEGWAAAVLDLDLEKKKPAPLGYHLKDLREDTYVAERLRLSEQHDGRS